DRHDVFLTPDEAVFVFESHLGAEALAPLLADPKLWEAVAAWGEYVAGPPRFADEVFSWSRRDAAEDVSFLPTPGPGDSDGGDIYDLRQPEGGPRGSCCAHVPTGLEHKTADGAVGRRDHGVRPGRLICVQVQLKPDEPEPLADSGPHQRRVLADSGRENK